MPEKDLETPLVQYERIMTNARRDYMDMYSRFTRKKDAIIRRAEEQYDKEMQTLLATYQEVVARAGKEYDEKVANEHSSKA